MTAATDIPFPAELAEQYSQDIERDGLHGFVRAVTDVCDNRLDEPWADDMVAAIDAMAWGHGIRWLYRDNAIELFAKRERVHDRPRPWRAMPDKIPGCSWVRETDP